MANADSPGWAQLRICGGSRVPLLCLLRLLFCFILFFSCSLFFRILMFFLKCQHGWSSGEGSLSVFSADTDEIKEDESHNVKMMLSLKIK